MFNNMSICLIKNPMTWFFFKQLSKTIYGIITIQIKNAVLTIEKEIFMKPIHRIVLLIVCCNFLALTGCANTANGMHQDWRSNTQKIANATGN